MISVTLISALRSTHFPMLCRCSHTDTSWSLQRQLRNDQHSLESGKRWLFSITCSSDALGSAAFPLAVSHLCFFQYFGFTIELDAVHPSKRGKLKPWCWSNDFFLPRSLTNYNFSFSISFPKEVCWLDHCLELHLLHSHSKGLVIEHLILVPFWNRFLTSLHCFTNSPLQFQCLEHLIAVYRNKNS